MSKSSSKQVLNSKFQDPAHMKKYIIVKEQYDGDKSIININEYFIHALKNFGISIIEDKYLYTEADYCFKTGGIDVYTVKFYRNGKILNVENSGGKISIYLNENQPNEYLFFTNSDSLYYSDGLNNKRIYELYYFYYRGVYSIGLKYRDAIMYASIVKNKQGSIVIYLNEHATSITRNDRARTGGKKFYIIPGSELHTAKEYINELVKCIDEGNDQDLSIMFELMLRDYAFEKKLTDEIKSMPKSLDRYFKKKAEEIKKQLRDLEYERKLAEQRINISKEFNGLVPEFSTNLERSKRNNRK